MDHNLANMGFCAFGPTKSKPHARVVTEVLAHAKPFLTVFQSSKSFSFAHNICSAVVGAVGGLVLMAVAIGLFVFWRQRRLRRSAIGSDSESQGKSPDGYHHGPYYPGGMPCPHQ